MSGVGIRLRQGIESLVGSSIDTPFPPEFLAEVPPAVVQEWEARCDFDRAHMHRVAADLANQGVARDVILAGLLHDIGKPGRTSTLARTFFVILSFLGPDAANSIIRGRIPFPGRELLRALADHAEAGAAFLKRHHLTERVVWLVRYHHDECVDDNGLLELQAADNRQ